MSSPAVLCANLSHPDALAPLFGGDHQFYGRPRDQAGARAFPSRRLERGESVILLAPGGPSPVGFTQLCPSFTSVGLRRVWIFNGLVVAPGGGDGGPDGPS